MYKGLVEARKAETEPVKIVRRKQIRIIVVAVWSTNNAEVVNI